MVDLTPEEIALREQLTFKLKDKTLTYGEALKLKHILEKEKEKASSLNDFIALLAVSFFLAALFAFISDLEKEAKEKLQKTQKERGTDLNEADVTKVIFSEIMPKFMSSMTNNPKMMEMFSDKLMQDPSILNLTKRLKPVNEKEFKDPELFK